jgi:lysophospholipase L1-like esterase
VSKTRRWARWTIAFTSLAVTYALLEFVVFPRALTSLPLKVHERVASEIRVLTQSSKRATFPENYVALVGDSYAWGMGDWLLGSNPWRNGPYHSAHVIQRLTGRDVISFGRLGSGSLTGLVSVPLGTLRLMQAAGLEAMKTPATVVVYFYGGNDFTDNVLDLRLRFDPNFAGRDVRDRAVFQEFVTTIVLGRDPLWIKAERGLSPFEKLFFLRLVWRLAHREIEGRERWPILPGVNHVQVNGQSVLVPYRLQSPALELDHTELALSAYVFEESLRFLRERLPSAAVRVVYVPSPLECYEIATSQVEIQSYLGRRFSYRAEELDRRHDEAVAAVRAVAERQGLRFLDATGDLRLAARAELVHGPRDWKHFNRAGYEALGRAVQKVL